MAQFTGFSPEAIALLAEFQQNNEQGWYEAHEDELRRLVRAPFARMMETVSMRLKADGGPRLTGSEKTMYRAKRDVRFARDKRPYTGHVSGLWTPSGRKHEADGVLFARLDAQGGRLGAGYHLPERDHLRKIRRNIADDPDGFTAMAEALETAELQLSRDDALSRMPRGFEDFKSHRLAEAIKLKSFFTATQVPLEVWQTPAIVDEIVDFAKAAKPLLDWGRP